MADCKHGCEGCIHQTAKKTAADKPNGCRECIHYAACCACYSSTCELHPDNVALGEECEQYEEVAVPGWVGELLVRIREEYAVSYAEWIRAREKMERVVIEGLCDNGHSVSVEYERRRALRRLEAICRCAGIAVQERRGI